MKVVRVSFCLLVCCLSSATDIVRPAMSADNLAQDTQETRDPPSPGTCCWTARIIDQTENVTLTVGAVKKHSANPLFGEDKPWEPRYDNMYPNVIYDAAEGLYKCWYTPFVTSQLDENTPRDQRKSVKWKVSQRRFGLCYAVSPDGLHWQKPDLGLVELRGSNKNNIVLFDVHGPDVIKDLRETDPSRRYKMFGTLGDGPHMVWFSPDGLRWSKPTILEPGRPQRHTQQCVLVPRKKRICRVSHGGSGFPEPLAAPVRRTSCTGPRCRKFSLPAPDSRSYTIWWRSRTRAFTWG